MPNATIAFRIEPAIRALFHGDLRYRCERDLHHHLTLLFDRPLVNEPPDPLLLGTSRCLVEYEHPTNGKYQWSRKRNKSGNVDVYFFSNATHVPNRTQSDDKPVAVEINYNYDRLKKIKQDIVKLIDPANGYDYGVYIAVACKRGFKAVVDAGLTKAFDYFCEHDPTFQLPSGLHIFVIENCVARRTLWESSTKTRCGPSAVDWKSNVREIQPVETVAPAEDNILLSRSEAEQLLREELHNAVIPPDSVTAKCMFHGTKDSQGNNRCRLGPTPLWDYKVQKVQEKALRREFLELVKKLCDSGRTRQEATRQRRQPP